MSNFCANLHEFDQEEGDDFNYMIRATSSRFRVTDVDAFRTAMKPWPQVRVDRADFDWDDEVYLSTGAVDVDTMGADHALHFPYRQEKSKGVDVFKTFDPLFLTAIQAFLRPQQICTLYEVSFDVDDGDIMRVAVIQAPGGIIQETNLDGLLCSMGVPTFPYQRIVYPGDEDYPADGEGPVTLP